VETPSLRTVIRGLVAAQGAALLCLAGCGEAPEGSSVSSTPTPREVPSEPTTQALAFRGLWVLCEGSARTLEDPARIDELIRRATALGVTDLFVQVYRGGRSWYDSETGDTGPFEAIRERTQIDPLARVIERAHGAGLRVHAWVNVLSLSKNAEAKIIRELGPDAIHVDRRGRSLLSYPGFEVPEPDRGWYRMGTPGLYVDPGARGVRAYLSDSFGELVARYPQLDGVHLDYIRYPMVLPLAPGSRFGVGLDFGYGETSRARFRAETGLSDPFKSPRSPATSAVVHSTAWDAWRRQQVTELVASIGAALDARRPGLLLSAAVIPYADRAYLVLGQDWRGWLEAKLVDFVVPMVYTRDDRLLRYQVDAMGSGVFAPQIWAGLGVWLFANHPAKAAEQVDIVRASGVAGDALFSYDAILQSPQLGAALVAQAQEKAAPGAGE